MEAGVQWGLEGRPKVGNTISTASFDCHFLASFPGRVGGERAQELCLCISGVSFRLAYLNGDRQFPLN